VCLGEETLNRVLKGFGLTDSEVEVYLFVSKHSAISGTDVARLIDKDKAQVFRTLKSLQSKGLVEATLEVPMRFAPVEFEKILEYTIKAKKDEAALIESTKEQLLDYWKGINKKSLDISLEKFVVIEGRHKIYSKISQMVAEAKNQLSAVSTVAGLLRAEQFGVFDTPNNESRGAVQFRLLTELSSQNAGAVKTLLKSAAKKRFNLKVKNPDLGISVFPRMVIRDSEEAVFFISPRTPNSVDEDSLCLWTNCRNLVEAFNCVFEDLWRNSSNVQDKIPELEAGKPTPKTFVINDDETAYKKYCETLGSAEAEIFMMTSPEGLIEFSENISLLKKCADSRISIRIMAPIISENLKVVQQLPKCCEVKHVATSHLRTTVVDGKHLFQFKNPVLNKEKPNSASSFENTFYTTDSDYVERTENMLNALWENASVPSAIPLESFLNSSQSPSSNSEKTVISSHEALKKISAFEIVDEKPISEKDILDKIIHGKKYRIRDPKKDIMRGYGYSGQAVIHPPKFLNLPDIMIHAFHNDKQSSYGNEDFLLIYLWLPTPKGKTYVPVAVVGDVQKGQAGFKAVWAGTPAGQNVKIVRKDELKVQIHGNSLFAGWTVPIPLWPSESVLPPSAILLEGYGALRTKVFSVTLPSGFKAVLERNGFEAFVTFFHSSSKYSGPGTDGLLIRDLVFTNTPP